jgi:hypothetical protein
VVVVVVAVVNGKPRLATTRPDAMRSLLIAAFLYVASSWP